MLKIDLKPLGKIHDQLLNNLQITWRRFIAITLMTQKKKKTFIFWKLKIDLKPLGKIYDHLLNNLQVTWRRFIVITLMTQKKKKLLFFGSLKTP